MKRTGVIVGFTQPLTAEQAEQIIDRCKEVANSDSRLHSYDNRGA